MLYSQHETIPFGSRSYPIRILKDITLTEDDTKNITPKWHEEIELLYFYSGGAAARIGDHEFIASDGDLIIINPLQIHDVYYHSGSPRYDCIMIDKSVYIDTLDKLCTSKYGSPMHEYDVHFNNVISCKDELSSILKTFLGECRLEGFAGDELEKNLLQCLFILLFRTDLSGITQIREGLLAVSRYQRLSDVFRYIDENYENKIHKVKIEEAKHY